jgi:myo-inositol-1(or 4)-monophosphatase
VWLVDPIDGTTNFVHGHPFWCVSIGLLERGEPVLGAVVAPALGSEWTGSRDGMAFKNGVRSHVSKTDRIEQSLLATGFPRDRTTEPDNNFSSFVRVKKAVQGVRRCGSAAIDLCLVADGTYDAYWERKLNGWDLAAGAAIVLAAGGRLSDLAGGPARIESGEIVASNGRLHDAVVALIVR